MDKSILKREPLPKWVKRTVVVLVILLTLLISLRLYFIRLAPSFFCDYIEYKGVKYYPVDYYSMDEIEKPTQVCTSLDDIDYYMKVKLYKNNSMRIGMLLNFYAENFYGFEEEDIPFLIFDSQWYTNDYEFANRDPMEKWLDTNGGNE